jgi:hypothetical protein
MKKLNALFYTAIFILIAAITFAQQAPAIEWQKCLGGTNADYALSIQQTADGGYIVAGWTASNNGDVSGNHGNYDAWVVKLDSAGNMQWQKCLGGTSDDYAYSIQQTTDGGYIVAGYTASNNGDVSGNHGLYDYWVVKLDPAGTLQWQKCLGGTNDDQAYSIQQTADGGYMVAGVTASNNGDVSGNHGNYDAWVVKLDPAGNMQWQKCLGGTVAEYAYSIQQTADGGYIVAGFTESNDGDVSGNHGLYDYWVVKLDPAGTLQWQKCLGGTDYDQAYSIKQTADGGYIVAGITYSNNVDVSGNHGINDVWVVKLDTSGNIQWQKCLGGTVAEYAFSIQQTADGGYMVAGNTSSNNGDVSGNHGLNDAWVVKLDTSGNIQWQKCRGGTNYDQAQSIQQTADGGYIVAGYTQSNNGDVSGNHGLYDFWVVKLTNNFNLITGAAFADLNSNGIADGNEPPLINRKITETGTGRMAFTNQNGNYELSVLDSGTYTVMPPYVNYYNAAPLAHTLNFSSIQQIDSLNDFAFQPTGVYNDVCVRITPLGNFRSGFNASYMINYSNNGNTTLTPTVVFFPYTNVSYVSSNTTPSSITTDSITWNIGTLAPFQTGNIIVTVNVSLGLPIGTLINSSVRIDPVAGDANPGCNYAAWEVYTTGSYDPNDIIVSEDTLFTTQFPNPPFLDYIIRFQNTGNDTAFAVRVLNNITDKLDLSSFELIASSHPMNIAYQSASNLFTFTFDNILLPDSNINEPLSHGFIRYRIRPKNNLAAGDSITNNAFIYFDFNSPVATNTAVTKIVLPTGISDVRFENYDLKVFPNPAKDEITITGYALQNNQPAILNIYDVMGNEVYHSSVTTLNIKLKTLNFTSGVYFVQLQTGAKVSHIKFIKQ